MATSVSRRQLLALGTVTFLVPALRLFPSQSAALAGRAAWISPLLALPPLLGYAWFLTRLMARREEGEDLAALALRLGGRGPGRIFLALTAFWTLLYAAFVLRAGADRLVGTIYLQTHPAVFVEVMGLLSVLAALAGPRTLVRVARMVQPLLLGVLLALLLSALFGADGDKLLPLTSRDLLPGLRGALAAADVTAGSAVGLCFLMGSVKKRPGGLLPLGLWMGMLCALLTLLDVALLGHFGASLTASLSRPFFVLVRTLVFFGSVERLEALAVMLWLFPDFLMAALYLYAGRRALGLLLKELPPLAGAGERSARLLTWVCGAGVIVLGLFLAPDTRSLERWSTALVPALNLGYAFVLLPLIYIAGRRGGKSGG